MKGFNILSASLVALLLVFTFFISPARADHTGPNDLILITNDLLAKCKVYMKAAAQDKPVLMDKIRTVIDQRKAMLLAKIENDPAHVEAYLLPPDLVMQLPDEIRDLLEVQVQAQGALRVTAGTPIPGGPAIPTTYSLVNPNGKISLNNRLYFGQNPPSLLSDSVVQVNGTKISENNGKDNIFIADGRTPSGSTVSSGVTVLAAALPLVSGTQRTVVLIANLTDVNFKVSAASVNGLMFTNPASINAYYSEDSFSNVSFAGDVFGPYNIPYASTASCTSMTSWSSALETQATSAGVNLGNYTRRIYVFPYPNGCSSQYGGVGTIGGNPSQAWILYGDYNNGNVSGLFGHEIGHNLGMHHASTLTDEYGDTSDVMGNSWYLPNYGTVHQNAPHKVAMGWIPSGRVLAPTAHGTFTYTVYADETTDGTSVQAVKIPKPDTGDFYYFGYRVPAGGTVDALTLLPGYTYRTSVHRWDQISWDHTYLMASLADGENYTDTANGVTVTQLSHTDYSATISIAWSGPPCTPLAPAVTLSPSTQTTSAGHAAVYTVTVKNSDAYCSTTSTFNLSSALPSGWSDSFSPALLTLASGASASSSWSVTSASSAADGSYVLTAQAADPSLPIHTASQTATDVIFTDVIPPSVSISGPSIVGNNKVTFTAAASDNVKVAKVEFYLDGTMKATDSTSPYTYTISGKSLTKGQHTLLAKAYDAAGNNASAGMNFTH